MAQTLEDNASSLSLLPVESFGTRALRFYQGSWVFEMFLPLVISIRRENLITARPTDVFLASLPKSGSTWLKAVLFATINRNNHRPSDPNHPLRSAHPQDCALFLEEVIASGRAPEVEALPAPRVLTTHLSYRHLPSSVTDGDCKIVYICREPKDTLVSNWHFFKSLRFDGEDSPHPLELQDLLDKCCKGIAPYGPMWDHWLGYWNESLKAPNKVLFLKYEDMIEDGARNLKRLAEFLGCPFSEDEENEGRVEEIVNLCSFEKLSGLDVNKNGSRGYNKNSAYFRKGKVGDWKNYLTSEMAEKLDKTVEEKLSGSGLNFALHKIVGLF